MLQGNKTSTDISQLLVVLSDGRGVYADGTQVNGHHTIIANTIVIDTLVLPYRLLKVV